MKPQNYDRLTPSQRRELRENYILAQRGRCYWCGEPLSGEPSDENANKEITPELFPPNFFKSPVHLQHNHDTGMTEGAVHAKCNAVMWEYYGR